MELISPTFAAAKAKPARPTARPAAAPSLAGFQAASVRWPLAFVLVGVLALLVGGGLLLAQPELLATYHYTPHLIAITHLLVLGFISSIVMGAMYQLVPVTLEVPLHSDRLVKFQLAAHAVGCAGMVWGFWAFNPARVGGFGALFTLGVGLFVYNLARTLARVPGWRAIKLGIASALFWWCATVLAGLLLVGTKFWNCPTFLPLAAMHAHAHLGVVGVFVLMIVTVSYKLVPMFTLAELQSENRAFWSVTLINGGLLGTFATILCQSPLKPVFSSLIVAGVALYGVEILAILRARNRRALDWGVKYFLTAIALLIPLSLAALALSWARLPATAVTLQLENVYGLVALLGLVGLAILGMLYKIVPFLVWFHSYSRHIGRAKVPALADMYSTPLQIAGYWSYLAGLAVAAAGTAASSAAGIRWGCGVLAVSLAIFALNLAKILAHFVRPQIAPFAPPNPRRRQTFMTHAPLTDELVLETLRQVIDPELGVNIVDLGLIYRFACADGKLVVTMTLTTPGCPMHDSIAEGVKQILLGLDGVRDVEVEVVWDPPWHPSMMTEVGRRMTGTRDF